MSAETFSLYLNCVEYLSRAVKHGFGSTEENWIFVVTQRMAQISPDPDSWDAHVAVLDHARLEWGSEVIDRFVNSRDFSGKDMLDISRKGKGINHGHAYAILCERIRNAAVLG